MRVIGPAAVFTLLLPATLAGGTKEHHETVDESHHLNLGENVRISHGEVSLNLTDSNTNSSLSGAQEIVRVAQAESRLRNAALLSMPRTNRYQLRTGNPHVSAQLQKGGTVDKSTVDSTGVNRTIADAAASVAEDDAAKKVNGTSPGEDGIAKRSGSYWMENMVQNGASPFAPSGYKVWRNVKDYGAQGDGKHDDTDAINEAISDGNRCGADCGSSSSLMAVVYFPAGTYLVSRSIVAYYFTQMIGDATDPPIIKVAPSFTGLGVISSNVYIEGGDGASWYINQNNFYRQVRNFIIDMTDGPPKDYIAGLHWQIAQATSLQNIKFKMSTAPENNQQGIFMENGSGGFMGDLEFTGGALGAYVGNQQFTVRNLKFSGQSSRALQIHWDWGWTWKGVHIDNCPVGVQMVGPDPTVLGSAIFIDSTFTNVPIGFQLSAPGGSSGKVTLNLFSVTTNNVPNIVMYDGDKTLLAGSGGTQTIRAWGLGKRYDTRTSESSEGVWQEGAHYDGFPEITAGLLQNGGNQMSGFFERSKPQYEDVPADQFMNLKSAYNAAGDGVTDDTEALNTALRDAASTGRILWVPAGVYIVKDTVTIPAGVKLVGQSWSQIMGVGEKFSDHDKPYPVVKVGNEGEVGTVEIQDMLFTVRGGTAGAIVLQWNIHESSPGSAAMWDTHVRIGGAIGSDLQAKDCPKLTGEVNPNCIAGAMLVHITAKASAYFENTWFWVADHDIDVKAQTQIDVFVGRGVLIESSGPVWLYGTGSEHCVLYQYQIVNAGNIFMGMIQTESPYYQTTPNAPAPFSESDVFPQDPSFGHCPPESPSCAFSWGVRILDSANVYVYGAGLYSWFQKYSQACVESEDCQDRVFEISSSSSIWVYSLITKASVEMISPGGGIAVLGKDNKINYCDIIMAWMGNAEQGTPSSGGATHKSPISATVIPFPATTVAATATFTISGPVVSQIDYTENDGNQNIPPGPGHSACQRCDLGRLITSTCCGIGGGISNPLEIGPGTSLPRPMILPAGFIPNQSITGEDDIIYPVNKPLPKEVVVPIGTVFPIPFIIGPGLPLSDKWSPEAEGRSLNSTLYLPGDFWERPHSVSCSFPCALVFPPLTTTTTWSPPAITYSSNGVTTTTQPPPYTTELIRISKTTVDSTKGATPTQTIKPEPARKPLCFKINLLIKKIRLCPPPLFPFPPQVPDVTVGPVPPGGKPGPTATNNEPTPEEEQGEEEEEDDDEDGEQSYCSLVDNPPDDEYLGGDDTYPGAGEDNKPSDYEPPGAGIGQPKTTTLLPGKTPTHPQVSETPRVPNKADRRWTCADGFGNNFPWSNIYKQTCRDFDNHHLDAMPGSDPLDSWRAVMYRAWWGYGAYLRVNAKPGCKFNIGNGDCESMLDQLLSKCDSEGRMEDNCAVWTYVKLSKDDADPPENAGRNEVPAVEQGPEPRYHFAITYAYNDLSYDPYARWEFFTPPVGYDKDRSERTGWDTVFNYCRLKNGDTCQLGVRSTKMINGFAETIPYPPSFDFDFDIHGWSGCAYDGSADEPGYLICPGWRSPVLCRRHPFPFVTDCTGTYVQYPMVHCLW